MKISEQNKELFEALANFQKNIVEPKKDKKVQYAKREFHYADLDSILRAVRPLMAEQGLSFTQIPQVQDGKVGVITIIMHCSGQFIESDPFLIPTQQQNAQGYGSCITYAKRYSLSALLGISADEDDDGNYGSCRDNKPESYGRNAKNMNLPQGVSRGAQNNEWLTNMKNRLAKKCEDAQMDKKFVAICMEVKFKKRAKEFTLDDYTTFVNNFDGYIAEVQEEAIKRMSA